MISSPEGVKLPEEIEKAIENAQINLARMKGEEQVSQKTLLGLSKEIQTICKNIEIKTKVLEELHTQEENLKGSIEKLSTSEKNITQETESKLKDFSEREKVLDARVMQYDQWEKDLTELQKSVLASKYEHEKKEQSHAEEVEKFNQKKQILEEALKKV